MEPLPDKKEFKAALQQGLQRIQSLGLSMLYASYVIRNHNTEWRWLQMHFTPLLGELRNSIDSIYAVPDSEFIHYSTWSALHKCHVIKP